MIVRKTDRLLDNYVFIYLMILTVIVNSDGENDDWNHNDDDGGDDDDWNHDDDDDDDNGGVDDDRNDDGRVKSVADLESAHTTSWLHQILGFKTLLRIIFCFMIF